MGFFKKRYSKNVARDNEFLKSYAVKCNSLALYAKDHEAVMREISVLQNDFQHTVPTNAAEAKVYEKKIEKDFETLMSILHQPDWEEDQVLLLIRNLREHIINISSIR